MSYFLVFCSSVLLKFLLIYKINAFIDLAVLGLSCSTRDL